MVVQSGRKVGAPRILIDGKEGGLDVGGDQMRREKENGRAGEGEGAAPAPATPVAGEEECRRKRGQEN